MLVNGYSPVWKWPQISWTVSSAVRWRQILIFSLLVFSLLQQLEVNLTEVKLWLPFTTPPFARCLNCAHNRCALLGTIFTSNWSEFQVILLINISLRLMILMLILYLLNILNTGYLQWPLTCMSYWWYYNCRKSWWRRLRFHFHISLWLLWS